MSGTTSGAWSEVALAARDRIVEDGVILCVRFGAGVPVVEACRAAVRGGVRILEITMTTPGAIEAIRAFADDDGVLVGVGREIFPPGFDLAGAEAAARRVRAAMDLAKGRA